MGSLEAQVAIVTGAASGIGATTARLLDEAGATVALVDRDAAGARRVASGLDRAEVFVADLAVANAATDVVASVLGRFGVIHILVNAAGIAGEQASVLDTTLEDWDHVLAVDLRAPLLMIQGVGRHMADRGGPGRIVNVTSSSAFRASTTGAAYGAAKAGLGQLTRTAAADLAPYDVNVNAVAPGVTATAMTSGLSDTDLQRLVEGGPLQNLFGRVSTPEDVAAVIRFLCEPASRQITAQTIHVSAGAVV